MEFKQLVTEMCVKAFKPLYIIHSEEFYFLDQVAEHILRDFIPEEQKDFNQLVVFGKEMTATTLLDLAREYPFMGDRRLVLVKDAHEVKQLDALSHYFNHPNPQTLLVLLFTKKPDGRSSWVKLAKDKGFLHELKALSDYQLPAFVKDLVKENGLKLEEKAMSLLVEFIGNDLATYANELAKLKISFAQKTIHADDIVQHIGVSKEFNVFELQRALGERNKAKVYWIGQNMAKQTKTNPLVMTIGALFNHFQKIWLAKTYSKYNDDELSKILKLAFKSFVKDYRLAAGNYSLAALESAIHWLMEYDLKSKGMNAGAATEEDLYLELMIRLSHV